MNLGLSSGLAGLSAAYPGYVQGRMQENKADASDIGLTDLKRTQEARSAFGNALALLAGGGQGNQVPPPPQQMMPGQPSQPVQQPGMGPVPPAPGAPPGGPMRPPQMGAPGGAPPMQQPGMMPPGGGMPPGGQPQMQPQQQQGGMRPGAMDWRAIAQAIQQTNPGIKPDVMAEAINQFIPLMNQQSQMEWKQYMAGIAQQRQNTNQERADTSRDQGGQRLEQNQQRVDQSGERVEQGKQRLDLAGKREERLSAAQIVRQDRQSQELELKAKGLEDRIKRGGERNQLTNWRDAINAQHKRAMEVISANALGSNLNPKEKAALLKEQDAFYRKQLQDMRNAVGSTTERPTLPKAGATKDESRAPAGEPGKAPPKAGDTVDGYKFKGGDPSKQENWTKVSG